MSDRNVRNSLRANDHSTNKPTYIPKQRLSAEKIRLSRYPPDKMHRTCCTCRKDIETYQSRNFKSRCCTLLYMCQGCYLDRKEFHCKNCKVTLYRTAFECIDTSTLRETTPTCDTCKKIAMPEYILPCDHKICEECAKRETFCKYVTDGKTETQQLFFGCTNHGNTTTLHSLQRVHKIAYGKHRNVEGLACVSCSTCLSGKSCEMNCGHYTCKTCDSYCKICGKDSSRIGETDIPRIQIQNIIGKKRPCNTESLHVKHVQDPVGCWKRDHTYNGLIRLPCGEDLCVTCMETIAENASVTLRTEESDCTEAYCICLCPSKREKHIVSLCFLKKAASEINYLTSSEGKCSQRPCTKKAVVQFRDCRHNFCVDCVRISLNMVTNKRTKCPKVHGDREFCVCNTFGCRYAVPTDQLSEYAEALPANATSWLDLNNKTKNSSVVGRVPKRITVESPSTITSEAKMNENSDQTPRTSADKQTQLSPAEEPIELENMATDALDTEANQAYSDKHIKKESNYSKIDSVNAKFPNTFQRVSNRDEMRMATGDQREILGIPNVGLTCYASCILQVLGQTPGFKKSLDKNCQQSEQNHVDKLLNDLLENVNVGGDGHFIIDWFLMEKLMQRIFRIDRSFRRYKENDCHSFIMTLLNALRNEESENETDEILDNMSSDEKEEVVKQCRPKDGKATTAIKQDQCPTVLFESRLISKFTYTSCEHEEKADDQLFRSILVPVQDDLLTLKEGVNLFFKGEDFPHNILPCRSCNASKENTVTTRVIKIAKAPKVLMLQLARFEEVQMAGSYKELRKTSHQVMFEKDLTLNQSVDGKELQYELYGVVIHTGSMLGGHYTSCVRKQHTNKWFYCSDSTVREIKEERIFQEGTFRNAYVLFYSSKT